MLTKSDNTRYIDFNLTIQNMHAASR